MYLSRLILNPLDRAARRDLADPVQLHRTVLRAFPPLPPGADFRRHYGVLYRVDVDPRTGAAAVLVQSTHHPDWSFLEGRHDYLLREVDPVKSLAESYGALAEGQVLRFRLRANVTKKVATVPRRLVGTAAVGEDRNRNGRRVALRQPEDQIAWLSRKGGPCGFELTSLASVGPGGAPQPDVRIIPEADAASRAGRGGGGAAEGTAAPGGLTFGSVLFEGRLRITDREAFLRTLAEGVGSAKAYGFGLLSLARA